MTSSPDHLPEDLLNAWRYAVMQLWLVPEGDPTHIGLGGRSLSGPCLDSDKRPVWLRVAALSKAGRKAFEGVHLADALLPATVPRPALVSEYAWGSDPGFIAHVWERMRGSVISTTPDLAGPVGLSPQWWADLRAALDTVHTVSLPPRRQVLTQAYVGRIARFIPEVAEAGVDLTVKKWEASHGDLHWANLGDPLEFLDWEGWGWAPVGYDAATLLTYALPQGEAATEVRTSFADVLASEEGRLAQLVSAAEVIQAAERDELHARLAPYARKSARDLLTSTPQ